ncbi:flagellar biosynthetic protein FliR [Bartonella bovis]|nr:flagellar biosynthetic protein FliR [Bartonella bovis]
MSLTSLLPVTSLPIDQLVIPAMLVFARVGACLMLMPGISSLHIPMNFRLLLAIAFSFVMLPLVVNFLKELGDKPDIAVLTRALFSKMLIGTSLGVIAHVYLWALQFMATIITMSMGYSGQPGHSVIDSVPETQIAHLFILAAVMLFLQVICIWWLFVVFWLLMMLSHHLLFQIQKPF